MIETKNIIKAIAQSMPDFRDLSVMIIFDVKVASNKGKVFVFSNFIFIKPSINDG